MLEAIFYFFVAIILYVYIGYPLLISLIAAMRKRTVNKNDDHEPTVTLIISAYNEAAVIEQKLQNCLALDYPKPKLEIVVFSDASTDATDAIVQRYEAQGIILIRLPERRGKTAGQNLAVNYAQGEIIVFSDANAFYRPDAIRKIVRNFSDPSVGCVCGELIYVPEGENPIGEAENVYWGYEKFLKRQENRAASILGANGSIYAVRKNLYVPLADDIISDFIEPLTIIEQGYRVVYEPAALCFERTTSNFREEYQRKKRIINRSFYSLLHHSTFLNPFKYPMLSFQLFSHKILRWFIAFYLPVLFFVNLFLLSSIFFQITMVLQCLFYATALFGYIMERKQFHHFLFYAPFYYCLVNLASFQAIASFLIKRERIVTWNPIRA